jgi:predicted RNA-binding protein associated with RNAse of E/G family
MNDNGELEVLNKKIKYQNFKENDYEIIKPLIDIHSLGVKFEYRYVVSVYQNSKVIKQRFKYLNITGKDIGYDILTIRTSDNQTKEIYFDTSDFIVDLKKNILDNENL